MKRWQDRGEVEDSEDDELELSLSSASPERPIKRVKQNEDAVDIQTGPTRPSSIATGVGDEDEIAWLPSKVANTYGRKGKLTRPSRRTRASPAKISQNGAPRTSSQAEVASTAVQSDSSTIEPASDRARTTRLAEQILSKSGDNVASAATEEEPRVISIAPCTATNPASNRHSELHTQRGSSPAESSSAPLTFGDSVDSSQNSSQENFPDARELFEAAKERLPSEAPSSPLSEREVSPPAYFEKRSGQRLDGNARTAQENIDDENAVQDEILRNSMLDHAVPEATMGRRSLRARKEIQLHPYLIDKAKYQRQCKERGIKPVRLIDAGPPEEESQVHEDSSQQSQAEPQSSSSDGMDEALNGRPKAYVRLATPREVQSGVADFASERATKRRRISQGKGRSTRLDVVDAALGTQRDGFSAPPSPPRTASETSTPGLPRQPMQQTASGFQRPRGLSPVPLPTPNFSSEVKRAQNNDNALTTSISRSRCSRNQAESPGNSSSAEEEEMSGPEAESESEVLARRLRREQKRIRGVLPASWLKIDFKAQKPKTTAALARQRLRSTSPERQTPQRGIAQRITSTQRKANEGAGMDTPSDGAESDDSVEFLPSVPEQSRLAFDADRLTVAPSETIDDDTMENDFVDAMLAGRARSAKASRTQSRQPRIADKSRKSEASGDAFSEERKARQQSGKARRMKEGHTRSSRKPHRPPVPLSIADAPSSPLSSGTTVPPFIRLAMRQASRLPDRGRHSPTRKVIRLATADDTREAMSVLRSWRDGTLAPRLEPLCPQPSGELAHAFPDAEGTLPTPRGERRPLRTVSVNSKQPRALPSARQKATERTDVSKISARQTRLASGTPKVRRPAATGAGLVQPAKPKALSSRTVGVRPVQLETLQRDFDERHRAAVFERRMQCLTESVAVRGRGSHTAGFQLAKYFENGGDANRDLTAAGIDTLAADDHSSLTAGEQQRVAVPHRRRKRQARRLEVEEHQNWQPDEPVIDSVEDVVEAEPVTDVSKPVLQGLGAFGTGHPIDFGTKQLPHRRLFREDSFIGSGDFYDAINLAPGSLDSPRNHMSVHLDKSIVTWSAWNEEVATSFWKIPVVIGEALRKSPDGTGAVSTSAQENETVSYLLRSVVRYCSKCLHFEDSVDREECVQSLRRLIEDLTDGIAEYQNDATKHDALSLVMRYQLVLAAQAVQINAYSNAYRGTAVPLLDIFDNIARSLAKHALRGRLDALRTWTHRARTANDYIEHSAATTIVVLTHTVPLFGPDSSVWPIIEDVVHTDIDRMVSVEELDQVWHNLFTVLPLLYIDAKGLVEQHPGSMHPIQDWTIVRRLLQRVFDLYENTSLVRGFTVNAYLRTLLHRCHRLIVKWHWAKCETMLYSVYDFFSKQGRMLLRNEECKGSPQFLEELSLLPSLDIQPDDLSFHIFLKTLAHGLIAMHEQRIYTERKIGSGITYRMIPTHGRTYPKEKEMQQSDVDALRNHHDLLCTLYYASPPGHRPVVDILRNLVDHANWHRKACQLNVRAWAMLTAYQASTQEPAAALQPLTAWFSEILRLTTMQYRLARAEAEHDFHHARGMGADIAEAFLHGTIANNQLQIATTLVTALAGLKRAVSAASSIVIVQKLMHDTNFWAIFELFDASQRRLLGAVNEALHVIGAALDAEQRLSSSEESQTTSSDSQDFGDFSALDELPGAGETGPSLAATTASDLLAPVSSFLSNVFGADVAPDDSLLENVVRVWIRMGRDVVSSGEKSWLSYVDDYSPNSWTQMRDTKQKRKFTPYYMSRIVEQPNVDVAVRESIITSWLLSLVEREALLKFQHRLTSALLNHCDSEALLQNLPFARDMRSQQYVISLEELRQRRLALISSVLSNMRRTLTRVRQDVPARAQEVRTRYTEMLCRLMQTMKHNYQELQANSNADVAVVSVRGTYVELVQQVVSFLQQHTADFCPVDKFFTDSSAFPLPATDPTYVIGKLKGYGLKLAESGPRRELTVFIQSVIERAAVDRQQRYLVTQMATAMCGEAETGDSSAPTLRNVLLTSIFPAYFDTALASPSGWMLSLPLLQACELVMRDMLYRFDPEEHPSATASVATLTAVLQSLRGLCDEGLARHGISAEPSALTVLSALYGVCSATLPAITCIQRQSSYGKHVPKLIRALYTQSHALREHLEGAMSLDITEMRHVDMMNPCSWPDTKAFAERQVRESANAWYMADDKHYVRRGNLSREVAVELGTVEEEGKALLQAIASFQSAYEGSFGGRRVRRQQIAEWDASGLADLIV
ncbi:hypothetical protein CERZMDRAFT_95409 [Cercospora zeae-maydis SCOH1-5]|uniref:Uncharacterized protein n=1 Tax=Cercospora zeae-maydis SCOH1-5 TaxID=717836 RepID=A0A6A6FNS1_9PEZI|nr:hypothetical protein CERZMDRAFT_95409 [Cercospora zeae-maydis SCOH1-5]